MGSLPAPPIMVPMTVVHTSVSLPGMATGPSTDEENDFVVADYFEMLTGSVATRPPRLQETLPSRVRPLALQPLRVE